MHDNKSKAAIVASGAIGGFWSEMYNKRRCIATAHFAQQQKEKCHRK